MRPILDTIEFFHTMRSQMRFGEFSRLPIRLHRFQVEDESAECDWFMRSADPWDAYLPRWLQQQHQTDQALQDALKIRELIFRGFPQVQTARLRMYREIESAAVELMMIGDTEREAYGIGRAVSLVMRAKLYGFRFSITGGVLKQMGSRAKLDASS